MKIYRFGSKTPMTYSAETIEFFFKRGNLVEVLDLYMRLPEFRKTILRHKYKNILLKTKNDVVVYDPDQLNILVDNLPLMSKWWIGSQWVGNIEISLRIKMILNYSNNNKKLWCETKDKKFFSTQCIPIKDFRIDHPELQFFESLISVN